MLRIFFFLFIVFYNSSFSQTNDNKKVISAAINRKEKTRVSEAVFFKKMDSLYLYIDDVLVYTDKLLKNKQQQKAIKLTRKLLNASKASSDVNNCTIKKIKSKLGLYYCKNNEFNSAIQLLKHNFLQIDDCKWNYTISILMTISYRETNDYYKSINYSKYALAIVKIADPLLVDIVNKKKYVNSAINISQAYNKLEGKLNIVTGRRYLLKAYSLVKNVKLSYKRRFRLNTALFSTYNYDETLNIEKGLYYLDKALLLAKKENDSTGIYTVLLKKGNLYNTTDYDKAIFYHEQSYRYISKNDIVNTQYYYGNLAYLYLQKKEFEKSKYYADKRVQYLSGKNVSQLLQRTNDSVIYNTKDKERLYKFLDCYAKAITANPINNKGVVKGTEIIKTYFLIDAVIDEIQLGCTENKSRLHWRKKAALFYSKAINACYKVNDVNSAFYFLEKNKAQLLLQEVVHNKYKQQLPEDILVKENELKKTVLKTVNFSSSKTDVASQMERQELIFNSKLKYQKYKNSVEQLYPTSIISKGEIKLTTLKEVQQKLAENEVLVSYFWYTDKEYVGNENLEGVYGVFVNPFMTRFFKITDIENFENLVLTYKTKVSQPFNTTKEREEFNTISYALYNMLFPTKEIKELLQDKKLLITSDSQLQNIPFEALITDTKTNEYLINSSEVSYIYSMSFLQQNKSIERSAVRNFVGYSPENFRYSSLDSLTRTTEEIKTIQNNIGGDIYCKQEASKESFFKNTSQYKIIHLATHANASENPWIAFNDAKLEAHELYTYTNQAELVVLSACETATGEIAQGEGLMSLARGFFHSGANSVLSTLWSANDKSTADIMKGFYQNLSNGETKSKALHLAKKDYIQTNSLSDASPYYWASFILIGDSGVVPLEFNTWYWWGTLVLLVVLIVAWLYRKK